MLLAVNVSGCAVLTVTAVPQDHTNFRYFECTESDGAAYADVSWAALAALTSVAGLLTENDAGEPYFHVSIITGLLGVTHTASAVYGFTTTRDCRQAHQEMVIRSQEADDLTEARITELERELRERLSPPACETDADCRTGRTCEEARCVPAPPPPPEPIAVPEPTFPLDSRPNPPSVQPEPEVNTGRPMQPSTTGQPFAPFGP